MHAKVVPRTQQSNGRNRETLRRFGGQERKRGMHMSTP